MYQTGNIVCDAIANFVPVFLIPIIFSFLMVTFIWALAVFAFVGDYDEEARGKAKALIVWGILMFVVMLIVWGLLSWFLGSAFFAQTCAALSFR